KTGIPQGQISDYENGKENPKLDKIIKLAQAFGVSVAVIDESLMGITGDDKDEICLCRGFDSAGRRILEKIRFFSEEQRWSLYDHIVKNFQDSPLISQEMDS
ncbi:MAG: helix-turn-helix domain-containing protein, partial [Victivallaceae bacterium]